MIEGRIKHLDLANRSALIVESNGNEVTVQFALRANVEIIEPETVGLMGGSLEDLEEGFEVEIEVASLNEDGSIICDSIACVS
ncbi:MAG TPA: hypothetical protein EYO46_03670 [Candidatus Lambdaproteobacteria bacterium]|jgi:hypothetical protein|nr:hypothetical protein [Candidatus Lambdaproteobacteria bacterium]HIB45321.1 hypothetical protein [Candidatus Lambdaproteobacteria bacterium]HIN47024.1 hypothetical protein [Deltaproteobacteria bacterium]HIO10985.1 hypothetical protein [Deltaproteobacteria bacterium]HIO82924.1 hypothetical protein [Deltaproteobacteria bacterium]